MAGELHLHQDEILNPDYISGLPDPLIGHILSFMSTVDAVKTSVLSKRWHSAWTFNSSMDFFLRRGSSQRYSNFVDFVDGVLCTAPRVLSIAEDVEDVPFLLPNCKSLTLNARMHYRDFPGIAILLAISPNLEELSINADYVDYTWATVKCDEEEYCCQKLCVGLAQQLKTVEIVGLDTDCLELKWVLYLVKYLLGDALALEKWVLKAKRRHESREKLVNPGKLLEFYQQLLCLPRASTNAELILQGVQHDEQKGK
ncbi:FBD-associated F-box protein At5g56370-like [Rhodamnia argentea]|uniref:FBD-associated F-box protein At5g56370-like n=1 Tax=Rhodamnia argentea TaxID=178133 RepID=A0ABM3H499_9MYRT|nr:FBD-associated F-box protein At5g56370-like [Rhodamnia argentea]